MNKTNSPGLNTGDATTTVSASENVEQQTSPRIKRGSGQYYSAAAARTSDTPNEVLEIFESIMDRVRNKSGLVLPQAMLVNEPNLSIPAIVFYKPSNGLIFYYTILLEAMGKPLDRITATESGQPIEIDQFTFMYYEDILSIDVNGNYSEPDGVMFNTVKNCVRNEAKSKGITGELVQLGACVLPKDIGSVDDNDIEDKLAYWFDNASTAINSNIDLSLGTPSSNVSASALKAAGNTLIAKARITPGASHETVFGGLVLGDFTVNLVATQGKSQRSSLHKGGSQNFLATTTGYIDFCYRGNQPVISNQYKQPVMEPRYDTLVVITDTAPTGLSSSAEGNILSAMFGLATVSLTVAKQRWMQVFTTVGTDVGVKPSVGYLGLEGNIYDNDKSSLIDVTTGSLSPVPIDGEISPIQVLMDYCTPDPIIAIDCLEGGPQGWYQNYFKDCKLGSVAEKIIIGELDSFSGGIFSKLWPGTETLFVPGTTEIYAGVYRDPEYGLRDLRAHDYLSVLKATGGDLNSMNIYSSSREIGGNGSRLDKHRTRELIYSLAGSADITSVHTQVYPRISFINAIIEMFTQTELNLMVEGIADIDSNVRSPTLHGMQSAPLNSLHSTYGNANVGSKGNIGGRRAPYMRYNRS